MANPFDGKREYVVPCSLIRKVARVVTSSTGVPGGAVAITIGDDTWQVGEAELDVNTRRHEDMHVIQRQRYISKFGKWLGSGIFWASYAVEHRMHGYVNNAYEIEARAAEGRV
jgi:hypothetical protein